MLISKKFSVEVHDPENSLRTRPRGRTTAILRNAQCNDRSLFCWQPLPWRGWGGSTLFIMSSDVHTVGVPRPISICRTANGVSCHGIELTQPTTLPPARCRKNTGSRWNLQNWIINEYVLRYKIHEESVQDFSNDCTLLCYSWKERNGFRRLWTLHKRNKKLFFLSENQYKHTYFDMYTNRVQPALCFVSLFSNKLLLCIGPWGSLRERIYYRYWIAADIRRGSR